MTHRWYTRAPTILESAFADLSCSAEVVLRSDAGTPGKLRFVRGFFWREGGLVSDESCAEWGSRTFLDDGFFEIILIVDVAPVVASSAALAESLAHASLGLGSILDQCTGGEGTFGASHYGRAVG